MKAKFSSFLQHKWSQVILFSVFIAVTSSALYFSQKSVVSFLLLLASLLVLHYMNLKKVTKWIVAAGLLFFLIPFASSGGPAFQSYMEVATMVGIYISMALGLNIVVGMAGLLDLGFVAFFAVGAYSYSIFATPQASNFMPFGVYPLGGESFWAFLIIGGICAAIAGVLIGVPVLRVKGDYLAIVTLGFGEIIRIVFNNLDRPINFTGGAMGISSVTPPKIFGIELVFPNQFYFVTLVILLFTIFAVLRLEHSKLGRSWKAVRENEIAAQAMGIPLVKTKLLAFALGATFSGMMGVVFAAKQAFIDPTSFTLMESFTILVMVVLGGMGSVPGVILGAAVVTVLNLQVLTELTNWVNQLSLNGIVSIPDALSPAKMQKFIFGAILVLFALYRPKGLIPSKNKIFDASKLKVSKKTEDIENKDSVVVENEKVQV
ncbi:branched-chain amino acid transport system permease protein [Lysinibacillus composti]|uniref:Branched-chain amino acid ABC transporter permease n=1 Tax=Lysinibacillus composti TaxID=720633 RepID=A0A3N9UJM3_9BACI|nr:branched-chain amino acid ABC transporter permease [Lysinibacillus composti]MBM7607206.1 branched-chain amino acid transport system permease protein [Lysinibacillus composti]RQW76213.1 branched-chain amino acid ABC transporter permease [Lysinibacillus composti]